MSISIHTGSSCIYVAILGKDTLNNHGAGTSKVGLAKGCTFR
jgi:hypothetical protein